MEDALNRLDKLTQEEARMAAAEILRLTQIVDNKVTTVINGESSILAAWGSSCRTRIHRSDGKETKHTVQHLASSVDDIKCS
jgi:uncharacterized protein YbcC (UPF0753/DUF2309 family)